MKKATCHVNTTAVYNTETTSATSTTMVHDTKTAKVAFTEEMCWQPCVTVQELRVAYEHSNDIYDMQDADIISNIHNLHELILHLNKPQDGQHDAKIRRIQCIFLRLLSYINAELLRLENICFGDIQSIVCNENIVSEYRAIMCVRLHDELENLSNDVMQVMRKRALIKDIYGNAFRFDDNMHIMVQTSAPSVSALGQSNIQNEKHYFTTNAHAIEKGTIVVQQTKKHIEMKTCTVIINVLHDNDTQINVQYNDKYAAQFVHNVSVLFPKLQQIINSCNLHLLVRDMELSSVSATHYNAITCAQKVNNVISNFDYHRQCIVYFGEYRYILEHIKLATHNCDNSVQRHFQLPQYESIAKEYVNNGFVTTISDVRNMHRCVIFNTLPNVQHRAQKTLTPVYDVPLGAYMLQISARIVTGVLHHVLRYYVTCSYMNSTRNISDTVYILVDYKHTYIKQHSSSAIQALMYSLQACLDYVKYGGVTYLRRLWHTLLMRASVCEEKSTLLYRYLQKHLHNMKFIVVSNKQSLLSTVHAIPPSIRDNIVLITDIHREMDINLARIKRQLRILKIYSDVKMLDAHAVQSFCDSIYKHMHNSVPQDVRKLISVFYMTCEQSLFVEYKHATQKLCMIVAQCFCEYTVTYDLLRALHTDVSSHYAVRYMPMTIVEEVHQPYLWLSHILSHSILIRRDSYKIDKILKQIETSLAAMHHYRLCVQVMHVLYNIETQYSFVAELENRTHTETVMLKEQLQILHTMHKHKCPCNTT